MSKFFVTACNCSNFWSYSLSSLRVTGGIGRGWIGLGSNGPYNVRFEYKLTCINQEKESFVAY